MARNIEFVTGELANGKPITMASEQVIICGFGEDEEQALTNLNKNKADITLICQRAENEDAI